MRIVGISDKLYSTVGGKPLLGYFARNFTVFAISNTWDQIRGFVGAGVLVYVQVSVRCVHMWRLGAIVSEGLKVLIRSNRLNRGDPNP